MFAWLKSLFTAKDPLEIYQPSERLIYKYFNGESLVLADPLQLYKKVMHCGAELSVDLKVSASQSKAAAQGHDKAVAKIRDVFGLKPFDQGGLSELECLDLLDHFLYFCDHIKKKSNPLRTMSTPSVGLNGTSETAPITPSTSDSGSAEKEPSTEKPEPSVMEPPLPSAPLTPT